MKGDGGGGDVGVGGVGTHPTAADTAERTGECQCPMFLCPLVPIYLCPCVPISLCAHLPTTPCHYVSMSLCLYVPVFLCPHVHISLSLFLCSRLHIPIFLSLCIPISLCSHLLHLPHLLHAHTPMDSPHFHSPAANHHEVLSPLSCLLNPPPLPSSPHHLPPVPSCCWQILPRPPCSWYRHSGFRSGCHHHVPHRGPSVGHHQTHQQALHCLHGPLPQRTVPPPLQWRQQVASRE